VFCPSGEVPPRLSRTTTRPVTGPQQIPPPTAPGASSTALSLATYGATRFCYTRRRWDCARYTADNDVPVTTACSCVSVTRMIDSDDSTLIGLAQNRDESAFAELVRRYQTAVRGRVCRILGRSPENEDVVQEIFLRTLTSLRRVNRDQPFGPWIMRITTNYCIDQLRRRKTRKDKLWSDLSDAEEARASARLVSEDFRPDSPEEEPEKYERIAHALLDQLKPRRRTAFILRELENKSYREVAENLGIRELTARVLVSRARADLHRSFLMFQTRCGARG